jgi:ABC-type multidrug transport system fused ATPase/permease subunit
MMSNNGTESTPAASPLAPVAKPPKSKSLSDFWRAMKFVWPYRKQILISIGCALFVGLAMSFSLAALTPILRVLLANQTIQQWADTTVAEKRLGAHFLDDVQQVQLAQVKPEDAAAAAGLKAGDRFTLALSNAKPPADQDVKYVMLALADENITPAGTPVPLIVQRENQTFTATVSMPQQPAHLGALRRVVGWLSPDPVWALAAIMSVIVALAVLGNSLKFVQEYLSDKVAVLAINDIRRKLYDHILHVPMRHFGRHGTSDVTSRLVQDSFALEAGFKTVLGQSIQQPIVASMAFGVALWTSWRLTIVVIISAPIMALVVNRFGKKMRRAARGAMQKNASMLGQIEGTLTGIRVVKSASAERWERRRYRGIMGGLMREQLRISKLEAASSPIMEMITLIIVGVIVLVATWMVTKAHTLSVTQFFLVLACLGTMGDSMRRLNKVNSVLQRGNAAAQRIFEVLAMPTEHPRELEDLRTRDSRTSRNGNSKHTGPSRTKLGPIQREVRFDNVTFTYPGASSAAVVDVSLTVPKGRCVAVVGRNGSGKTTLLALLPRFYDADFGRISIDGVDVRDATLRSLRGQISIVTQDSVIFPGTIAENIAYGHPMARQLRTKPDSAVARQLREDIEAAAKRAFAHEFILEKAKGYDTPLDGLGGQLSGGQKQRLCIARAILRRSPILILDEATSQVDAESEHLIQQAIDSLMHEGHDPATGLPNSTAPTTFVIAHRFATIRSADVIVVMDRGRIVGQGQHAELLQTCEVYQQLYERQLIAVPT